MGKRSESRALISSSFTKRVLGTLQTHWGLWGGPHVGAHGEGGELVWVQVPGHHFLQDPDSSGVKWGRRGQFAAHQGAADPS